MRSHLPACVRWVGCLSCSWLVLSGTGCWTVEEPPWKREVVHSCVTEVRAFDGVIVAGSGSALPLARRVAQQVTRADPTTRIWVAESIGTSGAVRALADGSIDLGLATRPVRADENFDGLRSRIIAWSPLAVVVDLDNPTEGLTLKELEDLYRGRRTTWPDGRPVVLLAREPGDSGDAVVKATQPTLYEAMVEARDEGRALELTTDPEMRDALLAIDGAIGMLDVGLVRLEELPVKMLELENVDPVAVHLERGRYPFWRPIIVLTRAGASPDTMRLVDTLTSSPVSALLTEAGLVVSEAAP